MPALWSRTLPSLKPKQRWKFGAWEPHLVVVNLMTNDYVCDRHDFIQLLIMSLICACVCVLYRLSVLRPGFGDVCCLVCRRRRPRPSL